MYDDPIFAIKTLFLPLLSSQLLLVVAVYFAVVRKRLASQYKFYICFLVCLVAFQIGPILQNYLLGKGASLILYLRISLLFTVGMPALLVANAMQCGFKMSRLLQILPFIIGGICSIMYVVFMDASERHAIFSPDAADAFPFSVTIALAHNVQITASLLLGTVPNIILLYIAVVSHQSKQLIAFILGSLAFYCLFSMGSYWGHLFLMYYAGSIVTALCWAWAVFSDLRDMKGEAGALIDEMQFLVQSNSSDFSPELDRLLTDINALSGGDLPVYKLRVRQILNRLSEAQMKAGADPKVILAKNAIQTQKIEQSEDIEQISNLVKAQAVEASVLIKNPHASTTDDVVAETKQYIEQHFQHELDIARLAKRVSMSRSYLMRLFKNAEGKTINQYLTDVRISRAKKLLETQSVTDTAFAIGFNNSNYFGTVFKKATGQTPSQFQQSLSLDGEVLSK